MNKSIEGFSLNRKVSKQIISSFSKSAELETVSPLNGGVVNKNFKLILGNPAMDIHLRIYCGEDAEFRARKEGFVYTLLSQNTDLLVPEVYVLDSSRKIIDRVFALQSMLPGVNLESVCGSLSAEEQRAVAFEIGYQLGQIHSIRFDKFGDFLLGDGLENSRTWGNFFKDFTSRNITWCAKYGVVDQSFANIFTDYMKKWQKLLLINQPPVLIHRDLHLGNIQTQTDQNSRWHVCGIYDFEYAIAGHNEFDFAKPYWAIFDQYPTMKESMLSGYKSESNLSDLFEMRMSRLYRLAELTDFLVFGTKSGKKEEVIRALETVRKIILDVPV